MSNLRSTGGVPGKPYVIDGFPCIVAIVRDRYGLYASVLYGRDEVHPAGYSMDDFHAMQKDGRAVEAGRKAA